MSVFGILQWYESMFLASYGIEHEKYMNIEEDTFVNYRKRRSRYMRTLRISN